MGDTGRFSDFRFRGRFDVDVDSWVVHWFSFTSGQLSFVSLR